MKKHVMLILIDKRQETAVSVQQVLTDNGNLIKTRLGIHDTNDTGASASGLLILELVGNTAAHTALKDKLDAISGVHTKLEEMSLG